MKKVLLFLTMFLTTLALSSCLSSKPTYEVTFLVKDEVHEVISFKEGSVLTLPAEPSSTDYTFDGWYYDSLFNDPLSEEVIVSYDFSLIAKLVEIIKEDVFYTVDFRDGSNAFNSVEVKEHEQLPSSVKTYKAGFVFDGWFLDVALSTPYIATAITKDLTLYGKWTSGSNDYLAYYNGIEGLNGTPLKNKLNQIITSGYKSIGYSSTSYIIQDSDKITPDANTLYLIYNAESVNAKWDSAKTWNKEHVWPRSKIGNSTAESDIHNLRACNVSVNSNRGNMPFSDSSGKYGRAGSGFYPGDEHVGDVARIILYMHVKWQLTMTTSVIGDLSMFLAWHLEDPVSDFERNRNEEIFKNQKNRNPFIDHPELVDMVFSSQTLAVENPFVDLSLQINMPVLQKALYVENKQTFFLA